MNIDNSQNVSITNALTVGKDINNKTNGGTIPGGNLLTNAIYLAGLNPPLTGTGGNTLVVGDGTSVLNVNKITTSIITASNITTGNITTDTIKVNNQFAASSVKVGDATIGSFGPQITCDGFFANGASGPITANGNKHYNIPEAKLLRSYISFGAFGGGTSQTNITIYGTPLNASIARRNTAWFSITFTKKPPDTNYFVQASGCFDNGTGSQRSAMIATVLNKSVDGFDILTQTAGSPSNTEMSNTGFMDIAVFW